MSGHLKHPRRSRSRSRRQSHSLLSLDDLLDETKDDIEEWQEIVTGKPSRRRLQKSLTQIFNPLHAVRSRTSLGYTPPRYRQPVQEFVAPFVAVPETLQPARTSDCSPEAPLVPAAPINYSDCMIDQRAYLQFLQAMYQDKQIEKYIHMMKTGRKDYTLPALAAHVAGVMHRLTPAQLTKLNALRAAFRKPLLPQGSLEGYSFINNFTGQRMPLELPNDPPQYKRDLEAILKDITLMLAKPYCEQIMNLLPSNMFGEWKIVKRLGGGSYGSVFLAVNKKGEKRAIKFQIDQGSRISPREEKELQVWFAKRGLAPAVYDYQVFEAPTAKRTRVHVIMMEPVDFILEDLMCHPETPGFFVEWLEDVGDQIVYMLKTMRLHNATHGDFHTGNIGFKYNPETKTVRLLLIDFGFASTQLNDPIIDAEQLLRTTRLYTVADPRITAYLKTRLENAIYEMTGTKHVLQGTESSWDRAFVRYERAMGLRKSQKARLKIK